MFKCRCVYSINFIKEFSNLFYSHVFGASFSGFFLGGVLKDEFYVNSRNFKYRPRRLDLDSFKHCDDTMT